MKTRLLSPSYFEEPIFDAARQYKLHFRIRFFEFHPWQTSSSNQHDEFRHGFADVTDSVQLSALFAVLFQF